MATRGVCSTGTSTVLEGERTQMDNHRCDACGGRRPAFQEDEDGYDRIFCNSMCQARFYGAFTNGSMNHDAGEALEIPSWVVGLRSITRDDHLFHGTWHTHDDIREKLREAGLVNDEIGDYDERGEEYVANVRKMIEEYRMLDQGAVDRLGRVMRVLFKGARRECLLYRMLLTPSIPESEADAFEHDVLDAIERADTAVTDDASDAVARDARKNAVETLFDTVYDNAALARATGEAIGVIIFHLSHYISTVLRKPVPVTVRAPTYQEDALILLENMYMRSAHSFEHKTSLGLTKIKVFAGEKLYKARSIDASHRLNIAGADPFPFWAAFDARAALPYLVGDAEGDMGWSATVGKIGRIGVYRLKKDASFIDMSKPQSIRGLLAQMRMQGFDSLAETMQKAFPIVVNAETGLESVLRDSIFEFDRDIAKWMCRNKLDGFVSPEVPTLNPEVMFCTAEDYLELVEIVDGKTGLGFDFADPKYERINPIMVPRVAMEIAMAMAMRSP